MSFVVLNCQVVEWVNIFANPVFKNPGIYKSFNSNWRTAPLPSKDDEIQSPKEFHSLYTGEWFSFSIDKPSGSYICHNWASAYGAGGLGGLQPPLSEKNSIIRAKVMYRSGKDTVNYFIINILIYLFSSRISPNLLTDLCTTSRDGCYYLELKHWVLPR